jgi:hypothetical protein
VCRNSSRNLFLASPTAVLVDGLHPPHGVQDSVPGEWLKPSERGFTTNRALACPRDWLPIERNQIIIGVIWYIGEGLACVYERGTNGSVAETTTHTARSKRARCLNRTSCDMLRLGRWGSNPFSRDVGVFGKMRATRL